jgi:hypothetical protein
LREREQGVSWFCSMHRLNDTASSANKTVA